MKLNDWLLFIGIILLISFVVVLIMYIKTEGSSCIQSPISYYQLKENTSCWCMNGFRDVKIPLT